MIDPTTDNGTGMNPAQTWIGKFRALEWVAEQAHRTTHQQEAEWTDAFSDAEAEALARYCIAVGGVDDVVSGCIEFPDLYPDDIAAQSLATIRAALEQLRSDLDDAPPGDESRAVYNRLLLALVEDEAEFGRRRIAAMTSAPGATR